MFCLDCIIMRNEILNYKKECWQTPYHIINLSEGLYVTGFTGNKLIILYFNVTLPHTESCTPCNLLIQLCNIQENCVAL